MNNLSSIQQSYWTSGSLGADAQRETLPGKVGSRTMSQSKQQLEDWRDRDNTERDLDPRESFVQYDTEYWASPNETDTKTVRAHLLESGYEGTLTRRGRETPFEHFSARWTDPTHMQTLALIPGCAGVYAVARTLQYGGPSFQEKKTF